MKTAVKISVWEKLILRIFASWCFSTIYASFSVRDTLFDIYGLNEISTTQVLFGTAYIFLVITLLDFLIGKIKDEANVDAMAYVIAVVTFGINAVYTVQEPYFASMVVLGVIMCMMYVIKKYAFLLAGRDISSRFSIGLIALTGVVIFGIMATLLVLRYMLYKTSTFDFGIFTQMFYNMKETGLPMTTCERNEWLSHFSVHVSPIYYLILPVYMIFPYNETLIIVQLIFLLSGVIPLYLICKNRKHTNAVSTAVAMVYLMSPVLLGGLFYDFHENKFLTTLILWMLYFVEKKKNIGIYIFAILILMVKEDAAIYVACIALYIIATGKAKEKINGLIVFGISVVWFLLAYTWLNNGGDGAMTSRYLNYIGDSENGVFEIINTIVKNPAYFFKQLLSVDKLENLLWVLVPIMFMCFRIKSIKELILMIPLLVINLMPSYGYQYNIAHQYYYGSFALLLYAAVVNLREKRKYENISVCICMLLATVIMCTSIVTDKFYYFDEYDTYKDRNKQIEEALEAIPEAASVSVTTYMMPNVSMRKEVYRYPEGAGCDYVVFDLTKVQTRNQYEVEAGELLENGYELVERIEEAVIIVKKAE